MIWESTASLSGMVVVGELSSDKAVYVDKYPAWVTELALPE